MQPTPGSVGILSIVAAVVPALLYISIIYWVDRYEKEPTWLLLAAFLWGAVPSILLALLFNLLGSLPAYLLGGPELGDAFGAVFVAPPVEETIKALALVGIFLLLRHEIDSLLDGIIYGAMVGVGFAMVENAFYFITVFEEGGVEAWQTNILFRAVFFGLNHSLFTACTGLGLAVARFTKRRSLHFLAPFLGWNAAVLLHALHNLGATLSGPFCLILPLADWGGVWLLVAIIIWALWQEKRWIRDYLKEEVALGVITVTQYETALSDRARLTTCVSALITRGPGAYRRTVRFYRHCSELAYKKHHYALLQEPRSEELTRELRGHLQELALRL